MKKIRKFASVATGVLVGMAFGILIGATPVASVASEFMPLHHTVFVNGEEVTFQDAYQKDGTTYVKLREVCKAMNVQVDWLDPEHHTMPIPGGNMPDGINLTNPTFVYTKTIPNWIGDHQPVKCVEITTLLDRYSKDSSYAYKFSDKAFYKTENGTVETVPVTVIHYNGRDYVPVNEFEAEIQPYLTEICMQ